jgi:predicted RND superfamily exporter protein
VFIPVVVVMVGIVWTFGFIGLTGFQLNMVTMVLAPLLISVGSAYIIHFMNQYYHEVNENPGMGTDLISRNTIEKIAIPMVVTALTTLAGFAALSTSPIPAVKEVGLFACFGIAAIILLSLSFVPALLTYLPLPKAKQVTAKPGIIDQFLTTIGNLVGKYSVKFIFFWVAVTVVAFVGMMNVTVNSQAKNFAEDSSIEMDLAFIQSSLAGTTTLRLVFSGKDAPEQLQTAQAMYGLQNLKQWILQAEEENLLSQIEGLRVDKVYSAVEYLDLYRNGMDALKDEEVVSFFEESE